MTLAGRDEPLVRILLDELTPSDTQDGVSILGHGRLARIDHQAADQAVRREELPAVVALRGVLEADGMEAVPAAIALFAPHGFR